MTGQDFNEAREAAVSIIDKHEMIVLIGVGDKLLTAVSKNYGISASEIVKKASEVYGGKGGGSVQLAQGGGFNPEDIKVLIAQPENVIDI